MEALVRWIHPQFGLVSPGQFIPLAEETDFIVPIGEWILRESCRQNARWRAMGLPRIRVSVNLSPVQFGKPDLHEDVFRALDDAGLDADGLELEVTESLLMNDPAETAAILSRLPLARDPHLDRRLRHRLLVAVVPQALPDRRAQDRPLVRDRRHEQPRRRRDRDGHHPDGPLPQAHRGRRGCRDGEPARLPEGPPVQRGAGLPLQPSGPRGSRPGPPQGAGARGQAGATPDSQAPARPIEPRGCPPLDRRSGLPGAARRRHGPPAPG